MLALAGAGIALTLTPSTAVDTFVSSSSPDYAATQATYRQFGTDPVVVLVRAPLQAAPATDLETLSRLEACLGGPEAAPRHTARRRLCPVAASSATPYGGRRSPCGRLMRARAAKVVYGPATFLNHAVAAVNTEIGSLHERRATTAAEAAAARYGSRRRGLDAAQTSAAVAGGRHARARAELAAAATTELRRDRRGQLAGVPSIADPAFLRQIVFGSATASTTPAARFSYLFPTSDAAIIQVRLRAGLRQPRSSRRSAGSARRSACPCSASRGSATR